MNYYFTYYSNEQCKKKRYYALASTNKVEYILKSLVKRNSIKVFSASGSLEGPSKKSIIKTKDGIAIELPFSIGHGCKIFRVLDRLIIRIQILNQLLFHVKKNDNVIVYHSLGYMKTIAFAKKLKNFKLILEVEEIYGDVINSTRTVQKELKFFKKADAYIFPTELLNQKINKKNRPYTIIHGTYNVESTLTTKYDDGRIHCVYAGTFDSRKGGAAAAAAALFLDSKYHIHIIGFGSENDKRIMINAIEEISVKTECKVTYDGCLSGEDYLRFIQKCDIGLSTQNPDAAFNDTSFPSKILSYMANGLRVVSVRIPAIEDSAIGKYMFYYNEQTPEEIARTIRQVDITTDYDSRSIISQLDNQFQEDLARIL